MRLFEAIWFIGSLMLIMSSGAWFPWINVVGILALGGFALEAVR